MGVGFGIEHAQEQDLGDEESRRWAGASLALQEAHGKFDKEFDTTRTRRQKTESSGNTITSLQAGKSMQEFLDFRRSSKERSMDKLQAFPERTQEMLRELLYPATPDKSHMMRGSRYLAQHDTPPLIIFPNEKMLHRRFQQFCRGSSMANSKDEKASAMAEEELSHSEQEKATRLPSETMMMDLRGFTAFMKNLGLIPVHKEGDAMPLQNSLAVRCFKMVQHESNRRTLHFVDTKEVSFAFLCAVYTLVCPMN